MSSGLGGLGAGPSDELLGVMLKNDALDGMEAPEENNAKSDKEKMLQYGKTHKKNILKKLLKK